MKEEKTENIYTALLRFQTENKWLVVKDSNNPFFKSKYADLTAISQACREGLAACGIVVIQEPVTSEYGAGCETILFHSASGTCRANKLILPYGAKIDPQSAGSAITYARRYSLASMLGLVAADEDDDANLASGKAEETKPPAPVKNYQMKTQKFIKTDLAEDDIPDFKEEVAAVKEVFPDSDEIKIRFKYDIDHAPADKVPQIEAYISEMKEKFYIDLDVTTGIIEAEYALPKLKRYQIDLN